VRGCQSASTIRMSFSILATTTRLSALLLGRCIATLADLAAGQARPARMRGDRQGRLIGRWSLPAPSSSPVPASED